MNRKPLIGAAIGVLGAIIIFIAVLPGSGFLKDIIPENSAVPKGFKTISEEIKPLDIKLNDISILSLSEKEVILEIKFDVSNPNDSTVLLEMISYNIYENDVKVGHGEIGQRLAGQLTSSNYYTILSDYSITIGGKAMIKNTGKNPEFWSTLQQGTPKWRVEGEAFYSTTSAFSGQAGSILFDFTK
ncbi:MAG: hypothetical protein ACREAF_02975 [Nitrosopumilaceae archaeon]